MSLVRALLGTVLRTQQGGAATYPIQADGRPARVQVEASPALSPEDGTFAGYIGSVHLVPDPAPADPVDDDVARVLLLDAIADHLTRARNLAVRAEERRIVKMLDLALLSVGDTIMQVVEG